MTVEEVKSHAAKYSQTYRKGYGIWKEHFIEMAKKTILKRLITKYAPKSIEMQRMAMFDQSVLQGDIQDLENAEAMYADNDKHIEAEEVRYEVVNDEQVDTDTGEVKTK